MCERRAAIVRDLHRLDDQKGLMTRRLDDQKGLMTRKA
jgi:hypothetical protein